MPRLAVLGQPVAHSRSPAMQNAALAELGLGEAWSYEAIEVAPEDFADLVRSLSGSGFAGVNVPVSHKRAALAAADTAWGAARAIGAANTLSFVDGAIAAANTDAEGIIAAIGEPLEGRRALVLGGGGSARAAIWALRTAGADVSVWNRTAAKAESLATEFGISHEQLATSNQQLRSFDLLLNATTIGLQQASTRAPTSGDLKALPIAADSLSERQVVVDLVYGFHETALASRAREQGSRVIDGLEVLVHQGAASLRIWTGLEAPLEKMRQAAHES